jgi:hypothetical protein
MRTMNLKRKEDVNMKKVEGVMHCVVAYIAFMGMLLFLSGIGGGYADPLVSGSAARKSLEDTVTPKTVMVEDAVSGARESSKIEETSMHEVKVYVMKKIGHALDEKMNENYKVTMGVSTQGEGQ